MINVDDLSGLWTRSIQVWADGRRDDSTKVAWLQGASIFADLRQPTDVEGQFRHVTCLQELTVSDCARLAHQHAFAGVFAARDGFFEWTRHIDYQPAQGKIDAGHLFWQDDYLVEEGLQKEHFEHWHRDPASSVKPCWGTILKGAADGVWGSLLRVGDLFMYSRDRAGSLPAGSLAEAVRNAANEQEAQSLIDFEVSFGIVSAEGWRIIRSTLPFREDQLFHFQFGGNAGLESEDILSDGTNMTRTWEIINSEGDAITD